MNKELIIKDTLKSLSVNTAYCGYTYLVEAISIVMDDPSQLHGIVKGLYVDIGDRHNASGRNVERGIRTVVESSYLRAPLSVIQKVFGNTVVNDKPTNKQYIATLADYIYDLMKEAE